METYIPKDLDQYEERIAMDLTASQLKWLAIGGSLGLGLYLFNFFVLHIPQDLCMYITMGVAFCMFWMGWRKWQNKRPYYEKIRAVMDMNTKKQIVTYLADDYEGGKGDKNVRKKTRKDRQINKQYCREVQGQKRK
ncbi:PrgI family mobile element protein [Faecalicoccus acidiformans]|uniref:PrgI family protein n=1 Tax=Faecalicoccus acidiformans TaxID=915173 RepID=A0ABS2FMZ5_9FIRM|nr:PrgI family protein [Faecalicoccus acidiformans]MBM6830970.1 PrgI family protein [Faecalicoccus acidiformans]